MGASSPYHLLKSLSIIDSLLLCSKDDMLIKGRASSGFGRTIRISQSPCHDRVQHPQHRVGAQKHTVKEYPLLAKIERNQGTRSQQTVSDGLRHFPAKSTGRGFGEAVVPFRG